MAFIKFHKISLNVLEGLINKINIKISSKILKW